jgi:hypothetical protein
MLSHWQYTIKDYNIQIPVPNSDLLMRTGILEVSYLQLDIVPIPNIANNCLSLLYRAGEILFSLAWAEMEYIGSDKTELANECMKKLGMSSTHSRTNSVFLLRMNSDVEIFNTVKSFKESDRQVPIRRFEIL